MLPISATSLNEFSARCKGSILTPPISPETPSILFTEELLPSEASVCDLKQSTRRHHRQGQRHVSQRHPDADTGNSDGRRSGGNNTVGCGQNLWRWDGSTGEFWIDPDPATRARLEKLQQLQLEHKIAGSALTHQNPAITLDGVRIEVLANVGNARDSKAAADNGAEGVGLLRSEFLFVSRKQAPTEDEQVQALREIYEPIDGPIIVRTLDVGAGQTAGVFCLNRKSTTHISACVVFVCPCALRSCFFLTCALSCAPVSAMVSG